MPFRTIRRPLTVPMIAMTLALTACPAEEEAPPPGPPDPTPAPTPIPEPTPQEALPKNWTRCTNEEEGLAIGYPEAWEEGGPDLPDCRFFDPDPMEAVPGTEGPDSAMLVEVREDFEGMADSLREPFGEEILLLEETEVRGREALRFELRQTEELLYPEGTTRYGYLLRLDGRGLLIETRRFPDDPQEPYEEHRTVVDTAATTLETTV